MGKDRDIWSHIYVSILCSLIFIAKICVDISIRKFWVADILQLFSCLLCILQAQYNFCLKIGDGTEDISCRMDTTNWTVEEDVTGKFSAAEAEDYWKSLWIHFIGFLVYPRVFSQQSQFPVKIGKVPPILNPKIAGPELFNTEHVKDSYVLKNIDEIQGSQNKLIELIVSKELELSGLDKMTNDELKQICQSLDFQRISRLIIHTFAYSFMK